MSKNAMHIDLSRQMKKTTNQQERIPHFGKSGTPYCIVDSIYQRVEGNDDAVSVTLT